jgi:hypothetical protein
LSLKRDTVGESVDELPIGVVEGTHVGNGAILVRHVWALLGCDWICGCGMLRGRFRCGIHREGGL